MNEETYPQYLRIALHIASQVADGSMQEGQKISGRSMLASEYSVSPETIRRALRLLSDMKVVEIKEKSGVIILSADNAKRYVSGFAGRAEQADLHNKLKDLYASYNRIGKEMLDIYSQIVRTRETPLASDQTLPNYEARVPEGSKLVGKSIGELRFWQATGATIVAIKRMQYTIVSPGPYAEIYGGDVIVFVCAQSSVQAVTSFISG